MQNVLKMIRLNPCDNSTIFYFEKMEAVRSPIAKLRFTSAQIQEPNVHLQTSKPQSIPIKNPMNPIENPTPSTTLPMFLLDRPNVSGHLRRHLSDASQDVSSMGLGLWGMWNQSKRANETGFLADEEDGTGTSYD